MFRVSNILTATVLAISLPLFAQTKTDDPMVLTLPQAIDLALTQSLDIRSAQLDFKTFESQYWQAIGAVIGDLKGTASYTRNFKHQAAFFNQPDPVTGIMSAVKFPIGADNGFAAGLDFEQTLFSGGRVSGGLHATRERMAVGKEEIRAAREDVVFAVKQYFFAYLLANATASIQLDNLTLSNDHLKTIRERYKQGLDSDLTLLRQQVEVASAETTLIQAKNLEDISITGLQRVLVLDVDRPLKLTGSLVPPTGELPPYDVVIQTALSKNATLSIARMGTEVAKDLYKITKADYFPDIKGFANYDWVAQSDDFSPGTNQRNDSFGAGVKLEYKLFTGGEIKQRVAQSRIEWDRAKNNEEKIEREIRVLVKQHWLNVNEARERARSQETAVGQAKRALEATEIRYKQGQASQLELNDTSFALNRARTIYTQASHDFWLSEAALERAVGTSLGELR